MKKVAVIYKSRYGGAKLYAEQIAKQLDADLFSLDTLPRYLLHSYDTIIWGGGIYAGRIDGLQKLVPLLPSLQGNQLLVFSVGFTPANKTQVLEKVRENSLGAAPWKDILFFHFVSGINYGKLSLVHKAMVASRKLMVSLQKSADLSQANITFLKTYGKNNQTIDIASIAPMILAVSQI